MAKIEIYVIHTCMHNANEAMYTMSDLIYIKTKMKGYINTFSGGNSVKLVLPPFWEGVNSKRK